MLCSCCYLRIGVLSPSVCACPSHLAIQLPFSAVTVRLVKVGLSHFLYFLHSISVAAPSARNRRAPAAPAAAAATADVAADVAAAAAPPRP